MAEQKKDIRLAVTEDQRNKLIQMIKSDPGFREELKSDWTTAFKRAGIDPSSLKERELQYTDTRPFVGGSAKAGITITITIFASSRDERISINEAVVFDQAKTKVAKESKQKSKK
jgi:hypothetical protein